MATTNKGPTPSTVRPEDDPKQAQERIERAQNSLHAGATPTEEDKKRDGNHPERGEKPNPDHADQPPAGSGVTGGEKDGRGEVFDQDRSPRDAAYATPRGPNSDPFSGSATPGVDDKR